MITTTTEATSSVVVLPLFALVVEFEELDVVEELDELVVDGMDIELDVVEEDELIEIESPVALVVTVVETDDVEEVFEAVPITVIVVWNGSMSLDEFDDAYTMRV